MTGDRLAARRFYAKAVAIDGGYAAASERLAALGGPSDAANPNPKGSLLWQSGRDWVWPQSASEEEIASYFETEIKKLVR